MVEKSVYIVFSESNQDYWTAWPTKELADVADALKRGALAATAYLDRSLAGIEAQRGKGVVLEVGLCDEVVGDAR